MGSAFDVCPISGDGKGLEIGFNNRFLMDAVKAAPAQRVRLELNTATSPCLVLPQKDKPDNFLYMVLPVRLRAAERIICGKSKLKSTRSISSWTRC